MPASSTFNHWLAREMPAVLDEIRTAFADQPRPEHFTNWAHCEECAEHDQTLRSHNLDTISFAQLGPGWDPICFISVEGFLYYMPALARLALGTGDQYYVGQFLFHLSADRVSAFTPRQRSAVLRLLTHIQATMTCEIEDNLDMDELNGRLQQLAG